MNQLVKDVTPGTLETFLTEELPAERRDIQEIDKLLKQVELVYTTQFDAHFAWPYELIKGERREPVSKLSHSTTAMIVGALLNLEGRLSHLETEKVAYQHWPSTLPPKERMLGEALKANLETACSLLLGDIFAERGAKKRKAAGAKSRSKGVRSKQALDLEFMSGSFGRNDVFTLAWVAEISKADWTDPAQIKPWRRVSELCLRMANQKLGNSRGFTEFTALFDPTTAPKYDPKTGARPLAHAFPALRLVQTIRRIKGSDYGALAECHPFFERNLHQQLSFSAIPDSRFDPAELMFCLEGMLQSQLNTVDRALFDRVITVLTSVQSESAFWRPVKPYMATKQGFALFPVSVEVANSLLRACALVDGTELHATYGSKCISLARRYWQWIRARAVRFKQARTDGSRDLVGWHSEHVNEPTTIHLWETSQVIEFLLAFRNLLHSHLGRTSLIRSRFLTNQERQKNWSKDREPVRALGPSLCIYKRINDEFIDARRTDATKVPRSMLLYGPPGTGKTTIAKNLARALGQRLITITVSDFLASGGAQVEARAKDIFEVLMLQPPSVVLFDEIDHFLLDRDSEWYFKQDTVFQFMTPGMLTKLNDLRKHGSVTFIVATNYEERIDGAIKRAGRIDRAYLLLPPDAERRRAMLRSLAGTPKASGGRTTVFGKLMDEAAWQELIGASLFLGWNDIEEAVSTLKKDKGGSFADFVELLRKRPRITSLEAYNSRFAINEAPGSQSAGQKAPLGEFFCLVALALETSRDFDAREKASMKAAVTALGEDSKALNGKVVSKYAPDLSPTYASRVADKLLQVRSS